MTFFEAISADTLQQLQNLLLILLAMILGAPVGLEREIAHKPAGLRTHMLVAGGAALLVMLSDVVLTFFSLREGNNNINADPVRVIEAIITGISFIGAGTIIQSGRQQSVEGLTTATSVLFVAAIGIAVALHQFVLAIGSTVIVLASLRFIKWITIKLHIIEDNS